MSRFVNALLDELLDDDRALEQLAAALVGRLGTSDNSSSPYLNVDEAAAYMRCSKQRVYDLRSAGRIKACGDGTRLLFRRADLDAYLNR